LSNYNTNNVPNFLWNVFYSFGIDANYKNNKKYSFELDEHCNSIINNKYSPPIKNYENLTQFGFTNLEEAKRKLPTFLSSFGITSGVCCKIFVHDKLYAIFTVYRKHHQIWTTDVLAYLKNITSLITKLIDKEIEQMRIQREIERADKILMNILPEPISVRLKLHEKTIADTISNATVLFADIVGFTALSTNHSVKKIVKFLNYLFSEFDKLTDHYKLEKIKTIGDCYMVAGGLLNHEEDHAVTVIRFASDLLKLIESEQIQKKYQ
jgi:hypothetical protein